MTCTPSSDDEDDDKMASDVRELVVVVRFPGAAYTERAVLSAVTAALASSSTSILTDINDGEAAERLCNERKDSTIVFLADYDLLPFEAALRQPTRLLCSSYIIRKALIRKHFLAHALHAYRLKQGSEDSQTTAVARNQVTPTTWHVEINFADELDELLLDDLFDLKLELDKNESQEEHERKWFILKPAMADRGNGIRLFSSLERLQEIFEEFEDDDDEEEREEDGQDVADAAGSRRDSDTAVMTCQLRHFVIQEYISAPLLLRTPSSSKPSPPRKFHLRAYVLCVGALKVYLADEMLALFAPLPYVPPGAVNTSTEGNDAYMGTEHHASDDLGRHLTNTCLQSKRTKGDDNGDAASRVSEENVYLFSELAGMQREEEDQVLSATDLDHIRRAVVDVLATTFTVCATAGSVHWQMWPNAFEVFGIDLLVEDPAQTQAPAPASEPGTARKGDEYRVWLLEINAQPDYAQTGSRLEPTIEHLFRRVVDLAVKPFVSSDARQTEEEDKHGPGQVGQSVDGITLCLDLELTKAWN